MSAKLKLNVGTNNVEAAKDADIIVIGVKPQVVEDVVREISGHITTKQVVVSVAASVPTSPWTRSRRRRRKPSPAPSSPARAWCCAPNAISPQRR